MINCKDHPDISAQRYCTDHRSLICKECILDKHEDHVKKCKPINKAGIQNFFRQNLAKAKISRDKINQTIELVENFMENEEPLTSEAFISLSTKLMNLCDITSNFENISKEERKEADFDWIHTENIKL
jgi:hypothetical protein